MKAIVFILSSVIILLAGCKSNLDPAEKAAKKQMEEAEERMKYNAAIKALNDREFVLEADRITFRNGQFTYVNANTNFVSVNGDKATIQLAFNSVYAGPNGIGGITVDGSVSNVKINIDKKGNVSYSMNVQGIGVSATLDFDMVSGSNQCTATVNPNFSNNRITFSGYLYPKSESSVFKGRPL